MLDKTTKRQIRSQTIYLKRLERLAAHVATRKPERFDFARWVGDNWKGAQDLSCGTTGCAWGHAPSLPFFQRLGVKLKNDFGASVVLEGSSDGDGNELQGLSAAEKVFNLTEVEALHIFAPYSRFTAKDTEGYTKTYTLLHKEATPKQWAKHARRFIRDVKAGKRYLWNGDSPNRDYGFNYQP